MVVHCRMPRMGKKTLYLDLDALDKLQAALARLPGRPSVSSYLNEQLPVLADHMDRMTLAAQKGGLRGAADVIRALADDATDLILLEDVVKTTLESVAKPDEPINADVPPKKAPSRRSRAKKE